MTLPQEVLQQKDRKQEHKDHIISLASPETSQPIGASETAGMGVAGGVFASAQEHRASVFVCTPSLQAGINDLFVYWM